MQRQSDIDIQYQWLGRQPYESLWQRLRQQAAGVAGNQADEVVWCAEHDTVYTTGRRGIDNRLVSGLAAPLVRSDRGGEMTFHGPGQLMFYPVINLRRRGLGAKAYVHLLEASCIDLLDGLGIEAGRRCGFPGVWVRESKIAALGVRVERGVAFHGMALNIDVDPTWFAAINPCGLTSGVVNVLQLSRELKLTVDPDISGLAKCWADSFLNRLMLAESPVESRSA